MEREVVKERAINIIEDILGLSKSEISEDSHINNDLGADSLDAVEVIMECENEFSIKIPDNEAEEVKTVKELIDIIHRITNS